MNKSNCSRRQFLKRSTFAAGALALAPDGLLRAQTAVPKRTAVDEVTLGKTGIKLSRLGMGTGSNSGRMQTALGRDGFNKLVHYAYDQGIRYFDCAESYATFRLDRRRHQGTAAREALHPVQNRRQARRRARRH